ncbi:hypothetical protein L226DRAFT_611458 [Lentinus tigrinus ALCF2SS1-7]|uniref:uncharacterized protein n=1 Tax=Lentinus tigrinus ALCF2SS1-7 TaxID=1328758 RepID=UPI0011663476|nr:hypothetical protein L226DRAFT_611458 [Lentinus tigrinus ALCF2SS1-7]
MYSAFHNTPDVSEDYHPAFLQTLDRLLCDDAQSNLVLRERAHEHLAILDRPDFAVYNSPEWMARQRLVQCLKITTKRIFLALYQTSDEFNMADSARFVSAGIYEMIAQALHDLARDWFLDLLTPFMQPRENRPGDKETWRSVQNAVQQRDSTCFMCSQTSCRGRKACCVNYPYSFRTEKAVTAAIFRRSIKEESEQGTIGRRAYGTLRRYCNLTETSLEVYSQKNTLLLHDPALRAFQNCLWCLKATTVPNEYDVVSLNYHGYLGYKTWYPDKIRWRTPAETSRALNVEVPSSALLRVHAMMATFIYRGGFRQTIFEPYDIVCPGFDPVLDLYPGDVDVDCLYAFEEKPKCSLRQRLAMLPGRLLGRTRSMAMKWWPLEGKASHASSPRSDVGDADPPPSYTPQDTQEVMADEKLQVSEIETQDLLYYMPE